MTLDIHLEEFHIKLFLNRCPNAKELVNLYQKNPNEHDRAILNKHKLLDTNGRIKDVYLNVLNNLK